MYDGRKRWYIILSDKSKISAHLKRGKLFLRNIASFLIITTLSFLISSMHFCMLGRTEYSIGMYLFLRKQICALLHSSKRWNSSPRKFPLLQRLQYLWSLGVLVYLPTTFGSLVLLRRNAQNVFVSWGVTDTRYFSNTKLVLKFI